MRIHAFILGLLLPSNSALAISYEPQPISYYVERSHIVAIVHILRTELTFVEYDGKQMRCGSRSTAEIVDAVKGPSETVTFNVSGMSLTPGASYLVFLEKPKAESDPEEPDFVMMGSDTRPIYCFDNSKDLRAEWITISGTVLKWNKNKQEYETWLNFPYNIIIPEDGTIPQQRMSLRALEIDGRVVEKNGWIFGDEYAIPSEVRFYDGAVEWEGYKKKLFETIP